MSDKRSERMLEELLKVPGNNYCADCHNPSPRWASVNLGITLCVACATIHRKLGTHNSRVKSITLDTWSRDHIQTLRSIGNIKSNLIYNPNEQKHPPPTSTDSSERDSEMEKYIRRKYEVGAFKAGASSSKVEQGVNSRDRFRQAQSLSQSSASAGSRLGEETGNRRNPELNNLVFKKNSREERDLPPLPPLSASRTGSSAGGGGGGRERPKPTPTTTTAATGSLSIPTMTAATQRSDATANLINLGGGTSSTLPLQSQPQPTFTQNGFNAQQTQPQAMFTQQPQFQLSPQPQIQGNGYFPTQSMQQQYPNNPFTQQQQWPQQQQQQQQQQFLSPSQSPSPYGPYGGAMGTSPGGTNPFLQMQPQQQQQMGQGQGQMHFQSQGMSGWNGQGQQNGWHGQQQPQYTQHQQQPPQPQYGQQQQQGWGNMGMAGMGMGYAQGH